MFTCIKPRKLKILFLHQSSTGKLLKSLVNPQQQNAIQWLLFILLDPRPGWSQIDMVYVYIICTCLLSCFFVKFGTAMGGFSSETEPKCKNLVYFEHNIVKSTQFGQNWVVFYQKWYTDGWVIGQKLVWRKSNFLRFGSGRYIHVWFWWKYPPPRTQAFAYKLKG